MLESSLLGTPMSLLAAFQNTRAKPPAFKHSGFSDLLLQQRLLALLRDQLLEASQVHGLF